MLGLLAASIVMTLSLGLGIIAAALVWTGHRSILRTDVWGLQTTQHRDSDGVIDAADLQEVDEVLNILLVGSDSREGLTPEQLQVLGTEEESGDRTDTIILARLDPRQRRAELLSFPRDLLVTRCDGSRGRINEAYQIGEERRIGGPTCLVQTIHQLTRIPIDHFVRVNFAGFIDLVDAVGGVSFYLEQPVRDRYAGLDLPAGCVTLDGARSIGFVRARHIDNDFGRIARQQRFIREIVHKVTSVDTLLNPQKLFSIVSSVGKAVETDRGFGLTEMRQIAYTFRNLDASSITTWTVPSVESSRRAASYVEIQPEQAAALFKAFRTGDFPPSGQVLQAASGPAPAAQRDQDAAAPSPPSPPPSDAYRGATDSIINCGAA
jgi:LCP family protein required for cell wall assembly